MAVCDSKGMIGVVSHVTEISSTVSLLTSENPSNQIPVMIINGDQTIYGLLKNYDVNKKVLNITLLSGIDKLEKNAKVYTWFRWEMENVLKEFILVKQKNW